MYKSSVKLELHSNIMNIDIVLDRRFTVVRGDSGTGKTTLVSLIRENAPDIEIESTLDIRIADDTTWDILMQGSTNSIIIFDDLDCVNTTKFAHLYSRYAVANNLYLLLFARDDFNNYTAEDPQLMSFDLAKGISYSSNSVFSLQQVGTQYFLQPYYDLPGFATDFVNVLVEDSTSGFEFFKQLFSDTDINVIAASNGKSSFCSDASKIDGKTLLLYDSAAFGCHMEQLMNEVISQKCVIILEDYECFEEFILQTSFFNMRKDVQLILKDIPKYANLFSSWEAFYEGVINKLSTKSYYRYTHSGDLKDCYLLDCKDCCNPFVYEKCDYAFKCEHKKSSLLKGSKYQYLEQCL